MTLLQHISMNANVANEYLFASFACTRKIMQMHKPIRIKGQKSLKLSDVK